MLGEEVVRRFVLVVVEELRRVGCSQGAKEVRLLSALWVAKVERLAVRGGCGLLTLAVGEEEVQNHGWVREARRAGQ